MGKLQRQQKRGNKMAGRIRYMTKKEIDALSVERTIDALVDLTVAHYREDNLTELAGIQERIDWLTARRNDLDPYRDVHKPVQNHLAQLDIFPANQVERINFCKKHGVWLRAGQGCALCSAE